MNLHRALLLLSFVASPACAIPFASGARPAEDAAFEAAFTGRAMRLDFHHTGSATEERVAVDRIRLEGAWPGSRTQLVDGTNLGKYLFVVLDGATNLALYSRGFA